MCYVNFNQTMTQCMFKIGKNRFSERVIFFKKYRKFEFWAWVLVFSLSFFSPWVFISNGQKKPAWLIEFFGPPEKCYQFVDNFGLSYWIKGGFFSILFKKDCCKSTLITGSHFSRRNKLIHLGNNWTMGACFVEYSTEPDFLFGKHLLGGNNELWLSLAKRAKFMSFWGILFFQTKY